VEVVTDTRRIGFALLAALLISIGITSVFYMRVSKRQSRPQTRIIVVATSALQPGTPLTADNLMEANWPLNVPLEGLIEKKGDVIGHILIYPVPAKEPILQRDLASSTSYGLAAKIPDGMRAMAVRTDEVANVAGYLFPGSHVDVLITLRGDGNDTVSRTVLQNVQVLTTGTKSEPDPNGKPEDVKVVTLLLTPEQSERLMLAQSQGKVEIALRNGNDSATPEVAPVSTNELAGIKRIEPRKQELKQGGRVAVKTKPPGYTVETVAAGKVTTATFSATAAEN
jgi:pilus assembly protein CpaB